MHDSVRVLASASALLASSFASLALQLAASEIASAECLTGKPYIGRKVQLP